MKTLRSWLVVVAVTTLSCGSDSPVKPGTACVVNSDCNNPLSCSFGTCHSACQESRDCPTGQRCVSAGPVMGAGDAGTSTVNVCQLAVEKTCVQNSDCKAPLVCARDLQCRNQCREDRDCATKSQKCIENVCADPDEFDATTMKLKDPPKPTDEGDNAGALAEFKRAYDLVPNKIVLFNIGMVYAAMNRPVEAVDALDQLLADPAALDADRAGRARHTREEQGHRVARLTVVTSAPAAIEIDGLEVGRTPLAQPLRVGGGAHVVAALALGHLPARKEVTIAGETSTELKLDLSPSESQMAHLTVKTSAPGIELVIDGQSVARTPVPASLTVAPGKHVVEARRRGYQTGRQEITLGDGASGELSFDMAEAADAAPPDMGRLVLTASESEPLVTVDGHPREIGRAHV